MELTYKNINGNIVGLQRVEDIDKIPTYIKVEEHKQSEFISNLQHDIDVLKAEIADRQTRLAAMEAKLAKVNADLAVEPVEGGK